MSEQRLSCGSLCPSFPSLASQSLGIAILLVGNFRRLAQYYLSYPQSIKQMASSCPHRSDSLAFHHVCCLMLASPLGSHLSETSTAKAVHSPSWTHLGSGLWWATPPTSRLDMKQLGLSDALSGTGPGKQFQRQDVIPEKTPSSSLNALCGETQENGGGKGQTLCFISRFSTVPPVPPLHHQPTQSGPFPHWKWHIKDSTQPESRQRGAFTLSFIRHLLSIYHVAGLWGIWGWM